MTPPTPPCLFCLSENTVVFQLSLGPDPWQGEAHRVCCRDCKAAGPVRPSRKEAIAAWKPADKQ